MTSGTERFLADNVQSLAPSGIRKFFDIVSERPDAISLGVGEPDFDTPWKMTTEGIRSLREGRTFYTANAGLIELRQAISAYLTERVGNTYDPKNEIIVTVGGSEAIDLAFRVLLNPGDEVIIPQPAFVSYEPCTIMAGGVPVTVDLKADNGFVLTPELLEAAITPKTKVLLLSYPNNPTGATLTFEEAAAIAKVVIKHDLVVVSDEIYTELLYEGEHVSIASLPEMVERTILINGFSKTFAMTGWRIGYLAAPRVLTEQMLKLHQYIIMTAPTVSQYAALEGLSGNWREIVEPMRESYQQRRNYLHHALTKMGIPCYKAKGAFYLFPDISQFGMTSEEFALKLLEEENLACVPGSAFGAAGEGYLRLSYAYSLEELKEAVERLERFVARLAAETE